MKSLPIRCFATLLLLFVLAASVTSCKCEREPTDEERLMKRIDNTKVHFYVAGKVAIAGTGDKAADEDVRNKLMILVHAASKTKWQGDKIELPDLSIGDALYLGKTLLDLKKVGAEIVRGQKQETQPVLRPILELTGASKDLASLMDVSTEHALFFMVTAAMKLHTKSPVPIPPEIVLYEAWQTDPNAMKIPGAAIAIHSTRAWIYGNNDFCDLAQKESEAATALTNQEIEAIAGLNLLLEKDSGLVVAQMEKIMAGFRAVGHAGVFMCHIGRNDQPEARPHLGKFLQEVKSTGVAGEEVDWLTALYDCMGDDDSIKKGVATITALQTKAGAPREDLDMLKTYCDASSETTFEAARRIVLVTKFLKLSMVYANQSGVTTTVEESNFFKTVGGFVNATEKLAKGADSAAKTVDTLKNSAKGFLDSLKSEQPPR